MSENSGYLVMLKVNRAGASLSEAPITTGELVYCIQRWRNHFESGRAGNKFASATMLKVCLCGALGPFSSVGPLYLHGSLYLHVDLSLPCGVLCRAFHYHMGPFTPVSSPVGGIRGGLCRL